ncbi:oligosaccharide flippase family protein [Vibrio mediterranei]|uniref:oligosaccharide flippase family protein n=1 Tax=Vibrio mediterranei TaxID=689 RepID=UPI0038CE67FB
MNKFKLGISFGWNALGIIIPALAGFYSIPKILELLGTDKFAILSLVWTIIGYFGFLDFGLSRAITAILSKHRDLKNLRKQAFITVALRISLLWGVGVMFVLIAIFIATLELFNLSFYKDIFSSKIELYLFVVLSGLSIILLVLSNISRGILEAELKFGIVNIIKIVLGCCLFIVPLIIAYFSSSLTYIVFGLFLLRLVVTIMFFRSVEEQGYKVTFSREKLSQNVYSYSKHKLISFGGWIAVANIVSPLMTYLDRITIGFFAPLSQVTYYMIPQQITSRLLFIPAVVTTTIFPLIASGDIKKISVNIIGVGSVMTLTVLPLIIYSQDFLRWWIDDIIAAEAWLVFDLLLVSIIINSMAQVVYSSLQALGFSKLIFKIQFIEFSIYIPFLIGSTYLFGAVGAASATLIRFTLDLIILLVAYTKVK